ncbi:MAG: hypothetical protein H0X29_01525 [Parachlamydiaceae bacterium]|nr:hypothetical protein [Parachlamydiaceae bacterium]
MIFEICAIVATGMLIILTIYIVQTLVAVQKSLKNVNKTISKLEVEMAVLQLDINQLVLSSTKLVEKVHIKISDLQLDLNQLFLSSTDLVEKVNIKISDLDPLFKMVSDGSNAINARHQSLKDTFHPIEGKIEEVNISEKILDIIDLTKIGIKLYQQFKEGNDS